MTHNEVVLMQKIDGFKYYYSCLSNNQKKAYYSLCQGFDAMSGQITLPYLSSQEIANLYICVKNDNPMYFYVSELSFNSNISKQTSLVKPKYHKFPQSIPSLKESVCGHLSVFDSAQGMSDLDKELFVHDYCLKNLRYDNIVTETHRSFFGSTTEFLSKEATTVIGPVMYKAGVCEGIAKYVKLALDYLGVDCVVVYGRAYNPITGSQENHAWNIVKIAGDYFHLDVTFNLTMTHNVKRYDYFNLSDKAIRQDREIPTGVPGCVAENMDYYTANGLIVNSPSELKRFLMANNAATITFKLKNVTEPAIIVNKVAKLAAATLGEKYNRSVEVNLKYNLAQRVFEVGIVD